MKHFLNTNLVDGPILFRFALVASVTAHHITETVNDEILVSRYEQKKGLLAPDIPSNRCFALVTNEV